MRTWRRYQTTRVEKKSGENGSSKFSFIPEETEYVIRTETAVPKVGFMLVGWGGNNV